LGSPDYNFNLGERDYGKIWREINDFLLPDHQSAPPILFAKGPHVVNSALFWLAQNSGKNQAQMLFKWKFIDDFLQKECIKN
jgi:hypothetical protein